MEHAKRIGIRNRPKRRKRVSEAESLPADAVLCPSRLLAVLGRKEAAGRNAGENPRWPKLVGRFRVAQDPRGVLGGKNLWAALRLAGIYHLLPGRSVEKTASNAAENVGRVSRTCQIAGGRKNVHARIALVWHSGTSSPGWAGLMLLARAAPYAKHRDNYSTWFDAQTMEPMIANPPMVQASPNSSKPQKPTRPNR